MTAHAVSVWDLPTRIFHWALVIAVVVSYVTGGEEGSWFVVHTVSGYIVALLLLFRLIWGFWGSAHSRFSDFIYSLGSVSAYVRRLVRLEPPKFVGHNPLGGWMVFLAGYEPSIYEAEWGKQKVPTLRNVDLRPFKKFVKAYGHNGYFKSLEEIVHFYNTRDVPNAGWPPPEVADNVNKTEVGDLGLSHGKELAIVAFLKTLSDGYRP